MIPNHNLTPQIICQYEPGQYAINVSINNYFFMTFK